MITTEKELLGNVISWSLQNIELDPKRVASNIGASMLHKRDVVKVIDDFIRQYEKCIEGLKKIKKEAHYETK
jgi:hypothetical protein